MSVRDRDDDRLEPEATQPVDRYERPTLTLVGNLNDLLAGGGSQNNDSGRCEAGTIFDETCVN